MQWPLAHEGVLASICKIVTGRCLTNEDIASLPPRLRWQAKSLTEKSTPVGFQNPKYNLGMPHITGA
jgi:hypothetical protein